MFLSMNYDSGHPRPANRPNFDLSKIAKIRKNRDFSQNFDFLYTTTLLNLAELNFSKIRISANTSYFRIQWWYIITDNLNFI